MFANMTMDYSECDFIPIVCLSASIPINSPEMQRREDYTYIQGSGDDHETWSLGLTPRLFWDHRDDILQGGRDECERAVARVVAQARAAKRAGTVVSSTTLPVISVMGAEEISLFPRLGDTNLFLGNIYAGLL